MKLRNFLQPQRLIKQALKTIYIKSSFLTLCILACTRGKTRNVLCSLLLPIPPLTAAKAASTFFLSALTVPCPGCAVCTRLLTHFWPEKRDSQLCSVWPRPQKMRGRERMHTNTDQFNLKFHGPKKVSLSGLQN